jgi:predicted nuclease with TOPRIM domain
MPIDTFCRMTLRKSKAKRPERSADVPVTQKMLYLVREELKSDSLSVRGDLKSLRQEMNARFDKVDARFKEVDSRFDKVDARFKEVDSRFDKMDARFDEMDSRFDKMNARFDEMDSRFTGMNSRFDGLISEVHRIALLVEEQNARNKIVMDGLNVLFDRQERVEKRLDRLDPETR